jgi:hypothetical protein
VIHRAAELPPLALLAAGYSFGLAVGVGLGVALMVVASRWAEP